MSSLKTVLNISVIIQPPGFYIIGFQTFNYISVYIVFLSFVYVVSLVFNILLISIIARERCLHTPKFLAVVNLAVIDILLNTCIIPSVIKVFLFNDNFVPFYLCLLQMYVYYTVISLEAYALAVLAYDRFIAICLPMRQNVFNTVQIMSSIVSVIWLCGLARVIYTMTFTAHLSFCKSVRVYSYFCDYAPLFRLSCNEYTLDWTVVSYATVVNLMVPFTFIVLAYISILVTVFRMKSVINRKKTLATCMEHMVLVAVFYLPIFSISLMGIYVQAIDPDLHLLCLSLVSTIPPCINPIFYSLKTKEIKTRVLALVQGMKTSPIK